MLIIFLITRVSYRFEIESLLVIIVQVFVRIIISSLGASQTILLIATSIFILWGG